MTQLQYQLALNAAAQGLLASQTSSLAQSIHQQQQMLRCAAVMGQQTNKASNSMPLPLAQIPVDPTPSHSELSSSRPPRTLAQVPPLSLSATAAQNISLQPTSLSSLATATAISQGSNERQAGFFPPASKSAPDDLLSDSLFGASEMHYNEAFHSSVR
ncbi:unnamed protein product [Gongylonema pulchrum]|uniref:LOB domain-containing protein n=1 Tax=Gongylonema pulchrum TaxID=637853 RepID=A0A183D1R5_9BILA|nr:unnamed protein product [Gongylonema pulchrum]